MRILWITPGFAADEQDFNCIPPMQLLALELLRQGVDLHIVTLEYPFRSAPYRWHGATVYPCYGRNRRWMKPLILWRALRFFGSTNPVTAIHSFWLGWASGLGERLSRQHGVRHFTTLMGQDVLAQNRKFMYFLNAARVARFAAVSDFQNEVFEKNTGLRAKYVIPWGVEQSEIPSALPASRPIDVIGVGSLVPVKNWEKWLNVVALTVRTTPSLRAELIGDGIDRPKLERLVQRLGLEKNVRFAGSLPRPEVLSKMREAKVLLHTAHYESFGYVLAEAAMNGCRVAGTPVGGMAQFGTSAENEAELSRLLLDALRKDIQVQPFVAFTMQQTAEAY
ncbi:MAG TPA: glycosyltransferase, partial [Saprospiraceae bacterium]|nr:glycosyltransferase [Saprospiraceae bacterium]